MTETALSVCHQGACCCCGAMRLESGEWGQLAGIRDRIVSFVTFDPDAHETTVHQVSHGYCPACLRVAKAELEGRSAAQRASEAVQWPW